MPLRWLILSLEPYLYTKLITSPSWHRLVRFVHRKVNRLPPEEQGGTSIDDPNANRFVRYYIEELKNQLPGAKPKVPKDAPPPNIADELRRKWDIKK